MQRWWESPVIRSRSSDSVAISTAVWIRGILANEYGLDLDRVHWVTFEDPHVAECRDPAGMQRTPADRQMETMLRDGELVAAAEEERFRRIKHWAGFPAEAIRYF